MLRAFLHYSCVAGGLMLIASSASAQLAMPKNAPETPVVNFSIVKSPAPSSAVATDPAANCPPAIDCPAECGPLHGLFHRGLSARPKIVVEQQAPEIIFRNANSTAADCTTHGKGKCGKGCVPDSKGVPQSAPGQPQQQMVMAAVPTVNYQWQIVPTVQYQYQMVPAQQTGFIAQASVQSGFGVQPQSALGTIGAGLATTVVEDLLKGLLAKRNDATLQDLLDALIKSRMTPQPCPDAEFQEVLKRLRAVNDRLGGSANNTPASTDKVVDSLNRLTTIIEKMNDRLDSHEKALKDMGKLPK